MPQLNVLAFIRGNVHINKIVQDDIFIPNIVFVYIDPLMTFSMEFTTKPLRLINDRLIKHRSGDVIKPVLYFELLITMKFLILMMVSRDTCIHEMSKCRKRVNRFKNC